MKILYLTSYYNIGDGASYSLYTQVQCDKEIADYFIFCQHKKKREPGLRIEEIGDGKPLERLLENERFDLVHYFKSSNSKVLNMAMHVLSKRRINIPVLTTVCQRPSYGSLLLTPFEIKHSSHFVFIDNASYNDPFVHFIPENMKSRIYLSSTDFFIEETKSVTFVSKKEGEPIVFGRGSTLGKCPRNIFDVFEKIDIPNKRFCISGLPPKSNWVRNEAANRNDVVTYDYMPLHEWIKLCATFDVFLYQLPENSYASIDLTLGLAMLMRKPVVYYGPEAPKERIVHGENGFIANTYDELAEYATLLGKDEQLREKMGEKARECIMQKFSLSERKAKFHQLYKHPGTDTHFIAPLSYKLLYAGRCYKELAKRVLNIYPYGKGFFKAKYGYNW